VARPRQEQQKEQQQEQEVGRGCRIPELISLFAYHVWFMYRLCSKVKSDRQIMILALGVANLRPNLTI
jgi:uncharacterized ion transporter superfamily protein YfcC